MKWNLAWAVAVVACANHAYGAPSTEPPKRVFANANGLSCATLAGCGITAPCSSTSTAQYCLYTLSTLSGYCSFTSQGETEILCCPNGSVDCGSRNGIAGTCVSTGDNSPSICIYNGFFDQRFFCAPIGSTLRADTISKCLQKPNSNPVTYTPDWNRGDCDGDGCPNAQDPEPCRENTTYCASLLDGGVSRDAGASGDAGVFADGGSARDSGTADAARDSGTADAGEEGSGMQMDAGADENDSGSRTTSGPAISFRGQGGFHCATTQSARTHSSLWIVFMGVIATLSVRRRRTGL